MIPYGKQSISQSDIDAVVDVLKSDWLTQGPFVPRFENKLCEKVQANHAVAVNSATSALHLACLALGLREGDYLWTSPITFVASANCALYCGAQVDFVDIDPSTYNLSIEKLSDKLEEAEKSGKLPKIVMPVHFAGQSCEMDKLYSLAKKYDFKIIEDASHAIGGKYKDHFIGGCQYSDITVFSFHPVKIITTGEGGAALTNSDELADKMRLLRSHGVTRESSKMAGQCQGGWYYEQLALGFNYRMTDMEAALGCSQLERVDEFIKKRHEVASQYNTALQGLPLVLPYQHSDCYSSFHLYVIQLNPTATSVQRQSLFHKLREAGIGVNVHYIPVHTQPFYEKQLRLTGALCHAENYYRNAISLPIYPDMTSLETGKVVECLHREFVDD